MIIALRAGWLSKPKFATRTSGRNIEENGAVRAPVYCCTRARKLFKSVLRTVVGALLAALPRFRTALPPGPSSGEWVWVWVWVPIAVPGPVRIGLGMLGEATVVVTTVASDPAGACPNIDLARGATAAPPVGVRW